MEDNGICSLLGLAMRAGRLAAGDEPVRELARNGVIRAVFLTMDAGDAISRQAAFAAKKARVPLLTLPISKETLGGALGRKTCAMCAVSDSGFAAKAAEKLAAADPAFREAADMLREHHAQIQSRRGIKKHHNVSSEQGAEPMRETAGYPPRPPARQDKRPAVSKADGYSSHSPARHGKRSAALKADGYSFHSPARNGKRSAAPKADRYSSHSTTRHGERPAAPGQRISGQYDRGDAPPQRGTGRRMKHKPNQQLHSSKFANQRDNNQPLADKKSTGFRKGRAPAIDHPRKLRR